MDEHESLVDRIYEAAVQPEEWSSVLHDLGRTVDAAGGMLLTRRTDVWVGWMFSPGIAPGLNDYLGSEAASRSLTTPRLIAENRAGWVGEHEVLSDDEYANDALITQWGGQHGLNHAAATAVSIPGGDFAVVHVQRRAGQPKFEPAALTRLDSFRPHLARASLLAARWRMERLRTATEALALIGVPAAVLDFEGTVVAANSVVQQLKAFMVWGSRDQVALVDRTANAKLRAVVAKARYERGPARSTFPALGDNGERAVVHLIPITLTARDIFSRGYTLLVVTPIEMSVTVDDELIQGLFDLTHAEAAVARAICEGLDRVQTAARHGVSVETVRTQLKAVFDKTGVRRQAELVGLLRGLNSVDRSGL
jgi:DNA-binding CsgD family transcriptional regulator